MTSLRVAGELVFVASGPIGAPRISILRAGATPALPLTLEGAVDFAYPLPWNHSNQTLTVRETPGMAGSYDVLFNVGSKDNDLETTDTVTATGLVSAVLDGDSIQRLIVTDTGTGVTASAPTEIATGLRNAFGIAFDPGSGDVWFEDNGIDGVANEPISADELNRIPLADIGGAIEDFGFPSNYFEYRTDDEIGSGGQDPFVTFQPVPPPNGAESEGPAEIAFAPVGFPAGLRNGIFVGFHGRFFNAGVANEENPVVFVDLDTGEHFHFIANTETEIGHPDTLLATADALFVADLTNAAGLDTIGTGVIYKIRAVPPQTPALLPGPMLLLALALALAARRALAVRRRTPGGVCLPGR